MKHFLYLCGLLLVLTVSGQAQNPLNLSNIAKLDSYTVATLPASGNWDGRTVKVSDAVDTADCVTGAGSELSVCVWNGSAWKAVGGGVAPVTSVNTKTGVVVINPDDLVDTATTNKFVTAAHITILGNTSGTNTGDQTTVSGNAGTATALAANGANCTAGSGAGGVDASGAAEDCVDFITSAEAPVQSVNSATGVVVLDADDISDAATTNKFTNAAGLAVIAATSGTNTGDQTSVSGNAGTATALAANPTDCAANQFAYTIAANGDLTCSALADADIPNTITIDLATTATTANAGDSATAFFSSGEIADAQIVDTLTASNYAPLAGATFTGEVILDNLGVDFDESDTNPVCAAGDYLIYADLSETTLKKCINGTPTDLDTGGAEVNDLEGSAPAAILTTEILIGTGAGTAAFAAMSSDATMANTGAVTLAAGITRDTEWDTLAEINAATTDDDAAGLAATNAFTGTPTFSNATYSALFTGGNVGIGTATPGAALQVVSTTSADQLRVGYNTTNYYKIGRNTADGVLHFQGTQATYNGYNFLSQAGTSSFFIKNSGSVGIGTAAPNASAILDLTSTTGALLIPRMTTTQRDALTAVNGMLIYNSTLNKFQGYENGAWASLI